MYVSTKRAIPRRAFLRAGGIALGLPWLEAMNPAFAASTPAVRRRMVCIMTPLGIHAENLFPQESGRGYTVSRYLKTLEPLRDHFTVFSGLYHPDVETGHDSERSFLTAAPHPAQPGFRNSVSLDQVAAEHSGADTRFASMQLSSNSGSISWSRGGVLIPSERSPSQTFAKLFLNGNAAQLQRQKEKLQVGRSIMDALGGAAKRFQRSLGHDDQEKLDEYFTSVRELEQKLAKGQEWAQKPKPQVDVKPPEDIRDETDLIGRTRLWYDLMHLALQTDSTRLFTLSLQNCGFLLPVPGVTLGRHDLSHHGKDPEKLRQLALVEEAELEALGGFLAKLHGTSEGGATLLEQTMVLFGSNLGNASSHDTRNLPIILAGGGFKHGQHLAFDLKNPPPLSNLYVQMLQRLGVETERFGSSTSTSLPGFAS
jgi:hypothetical protein